LIDPEKIKENPPWRIQRDPRKIQRDPGKIQVYEENTGG
jgi:hypothetical protein